MTLSLVARYEPLSLVEENTADAAILNFKRFIKFAWPVLEPGVPLIWTWHIDALAEHLQAVFYRQIQRLVVSMPPGFAKSSIVSTLFTAWTLLNDPAIRWLCASHSFDLAIRDNKNCRDLLQSEWFQARYGDRLKLKGDQNQKEFFETTQRGYRLAVAVRSSGTGKRGTHLLIDDPNNAMAGEADIAAAREWFGRTWISRSNDQQNGPMIIVGQRLHETDVIGHVLSLGGWEHLNLPAEYEPTRKCSTSIGWSDPRTEAGQLLWPEKFDERVLQKLKRSLGSINYAAQYQQSPVPASGGQFKRQWFRYFEIQGNYYILHTADGTKPIAKKACSIFAVVDPAISSKQEADFTVIQVWAKTPDNELLLLAQVRDHLDNPEQQQTIVRLHARFLFVFLAVETIGYQLALFQQLRKKGIPVKEYKPVRDKVARASVAAIKMEAGDMYFELGAEYLTDLESEVLKFPKGEHDDQVDDLSMAADITTLVRTASDHLDYARRYQEARQKAQEAKA